MWMRWKVKAHAKRFLREHYFKALIVCMIVWALGSGITSNTQFDKPKHKERHTIFEGEKVIVGLKNPIFNYGLRKMGLSYNFKVKKGMAFIVFILTFALSVFVGNVAEVGKARFFLKGLRVGETDTIDVFSAFNHEEYMDVVKTQFYRAFYTVLWTLLFVIPGVVKSYEYRMVPYIIAEEPNLTHREAIKRSRVMTYGHKWGMFVLDLSFFGWNLLGALFFGVGGVFVIPYEEASYAVLYNVLSGYNDKEIDVSYEIS